jgi:hypothetical protein
VYERHFPQSYRIDMSAADQGFGSLCILEVRNGGPKPVSAAPGPGTLIVCVNAPLTGMALLAIGRQVASGKRVIGLWNWELT